MATYNKFQDFVEQLCTAKHDFTASGHVVKVMLCSDADAPTASDTIRANITGELSTANGYTSGGEDAQNTLAESSGTATVTCTNITWTASGGSIGPFRYVVAYNDTQTSPADALIAWWDYGSNLTLNTGESFTVKFNGGASSGTLFTVA